jgi:DNA-binding transcriptional LysR family regulator
VAALSEPAHPAKVMARVLALLNPYFDKDTPQAIREIEAEDWAAALGCQPYWAIEKAARWWKSDANPDRRKRPLEGDLVARVKREMDAVNAARFMLARGCCFAIPSRKAASRARAGTHQWR